MQPDGSHNRYERSQKKIAKVYAVPSLFSAPGTSASFRERKWLHKSKLVPTVAGRSVAMRPWKYYHDVN